MSEAINDQSVWLLLSQEEYALIQAALLKYWQSGVADETAERLLLELMEQEKEAE